MFVICSKDALNTPSNQADYYTLGRILNSPPLDAKYNMSVMRTYKDDVIPLRLRVISGIIKEKWSY